MKARFALIAVTLLMLAGIRAEAQSVLTSPGESSKLGYIVTPNGVDDTAQIQAACGGVGGTVPVQLNPGTYRISKSLKCNNLIALASNDCTVYYETGPCTTILLQISGTWASGDAVVQATSGNPAYYSNFEVTCGDLGLDGVDAFDFTSVIGATYSHTFAFRCNIGYAMVGAGNLAYNLLCDACMASQNQLWGFSTGSGTLSDSEFRSIHFIDNGKSTTTTSGDGGIYCGSCYAVGFIGGQVEDNYGAASNGSLGCGIYFDSGSSIDRVMGMKFDQNEYCGDITLNAGSSFGAYGITVTGNISTTTRGASFPAETTNISLRFLGTTYVENFTSTGNLWTSPARVVNVSDQLWGAHFDDRWAVGIGEDQYSAQVIGAHSVANAAPSLRIADSYNQFLGTQQTSVTEAAPAATTSTLGVMMGLGVNATPAFIFNPVIHPRAQITCSGTIANNTIGGSSTVGLRYGTGTPPANAAALTGTDAGVAQRYTASTAAGTGVFSFTTLLSGLALFDSTDGAAPPMWFDLTLASDNSGHTATVTNVNCLAAEQ